MEDKEDKNKSENKANQDDNFDLMEHYFGHLLLPYEIESTPNKEKVKYDFGDLHLLKDCELQDKVENSLLDLAVADRSRLDGFDEEKLDDLIANHIDNLMLLIAILLDDPSKDVKIPNPVFDIDHNKLDLMSFIKDTPKEIPEITISINKRKVKITDQSVIDKLIDVLKNSKPKLSNAELKYLKNPEDFKKNRRQQYYKNSAYRSTITFMLLMYLENETLFKRSPGSATSDYQMLIIGKILQWAQLVETQIEVPQADKSVKMQDINNKALLKGVRDNLKHYWPGLIEYSRRQQ